MQIWMLTPFKIKRKTRGHVHSTMYANYRTGRGFCTICMDAKIITPQFDLTLVGSNHIMGETTIDHGNTLCCCFAADRDTI